MKLLMAICFCLFSVLMISCERNSHYSDLEKHIEQLKAEEAQKLKGLSTTPPLVAPKPATYTAKALRSPFSQTAVTANVPNKAISSNPLQAYGLSMLRFVGTIQKSKTTYAYVLTPDNTIYQVKEGDFIGDRGGKVFKIAADRLEVREEERARSGVAMQRIITLQLKGQ